MSQVQQKVRELVNKIIADGAYCCSLNEVKDMVAEANTVLIMMSCPLHKTYSFEVHYVEPVISTEPLQDTELIRRIALGIVTNIARNPGRETL